MIKVLLQRTSLLYTFALLASILLSAWVDVREAVINPDAICYLYSAEEVGKSGLHAAMHLCPQAIWPFYSVLIFTLVQLTHLSYTTAAFVLNGLFSALSVLMFITIVKELGGSRRVLWLAAIVILSFHEFNILRQDIIRDHGFWFFYLTSLYFLLRFFRHSNWLNAFAFSSSLLIATLFRIEGAIFLLALPLLSWCRVNQGWLIRLQNFLKLNSLLGVAAIGLFIWLLLHPQQTIQQFGRISEIGHQMRQGVMIMWETYQRTRLVIAQHILSANSIRDADLVVCLLMLVWYFVNVIGNVSWIYAALVMYAWLTKAASFSRSAQLVICGYLALNIIVTLGFFAENQFLAKRYLIALSLILLLWVPFALGKLWQLTESRQRGLRWLAVFFIFISLLSSVFHFGHSKAYIRNAGDWLAQNIPQDAQLYSNDYQLMYYSQHFGPAIFQKLVEYKDLSMIAHEQWKQYDYLALLISKDDDEKLIAIRQEIHDTPVQIFSGGGNKYVYIYKIMHQEKRS